MNDLIIGLCLGFTAGCVYTYWFWRREIRSFYQPTKFRDGHADR